MVFDPVLVLLYHKRFFLFRQNQRLLSVKTPKARPQKGALPLEQSYYRIGEVSRATGLSKDTLHFYDKIGLLSPDHVDPQNGYRYYSLA